MVFTLTFFYLYKESPLAPTSTEVYRKQIKKYIPPPLRALRVFFSSVTEDSGPSKALSAQKHLKFDFVENEQVQNIILSPNIKKQGNAFDIEILGNLEYIQQGSPLL